MTGARSRKWPAAVTAALAALVVAAGCSRGAPHVAAEVEGRQILSADTRALAAAYAGSELARATRVELGQAETTRLVLAYQIRLSYLEALADEMGIAPARSAETELAADAVESGSFDALGLRPEDFARSLRAGELSRAMAAKVFPDVPVSEAALREEYDRRAVAFQQSWRSTVRMAYFGAKDPADQVATRVREGQGFDSAASALGAQWTQQAVVNPITSSLPAPIVEAMGQLVSGQVSDALPAGAGWLCVLVERREDLPRVSFPEASPELRDLLVDRERQSRFLGWFTDKLVKAKVRVDGHYGKWNSQFASVQ